jgi:CHAT domain-containing protein/tetratricopeptide (TPR) repeat protein
VGVCSPTPRRYVAAYGSAAFASPGLAAAALALAARIASGLAAAALGVAAFPPPASAAPATVHSPPSPLAQRVARDSAAAVALLAAQQPDSARAVLRAGAAASRRAGDRRALARYLRMLGVSHARLGDGAPARPLLAEAIGLAEALPDTALLLDAMRWQCYALGATGQLAEQERLARRLLAAADARRDTRYQAFAHSYLGWIAHQRSDFPAARRHLAWAVERFREHELPRDEAIALTPLGSTYMALGEFDAARRAYRRGLALARGLGQRWSEAQTLNDLGVLEWRTGDAARAARHFREGYTLHRALGSDLEATLGLINLVKVEQVLGHFDESVRLAREGLEVCAAKGYRLEHGWMLAALGYAEARRGRRGEAVAAWRRCLELGGATAAAARVSAVLGLAQTLRDRDSAAAALDLLERHSALMAAAAGGEDALEVETLTAALLLGAGDPGEAARTARKLARRAGRLGLNERAMDAWHLLGRAEAALGRPGAARAAFERAAAAWEARRGLASSAEWREPFGSEGAALAEDYVGLVLRHPAPAAVAGAAVGERVAGAERAAPDAAAADERVAAAFALAQRFKTRTLLERVAGPRASPAGDAEAATPPLATLAALQREVLADHELLLEALVGRDTTLLFAVTQRECRVVRLPGSAELGRRIELALDVLSAPPAWSAHAEAARAVARELSALLLGEVEDLVAASRTLIVAPDGPLHRVPFSALSLPAEEAPLVARRAVVRAPSATLLARLRAPRAAAPAPTGVLAFAGGLWRDGRLLAGALREAELLGRTFRGVEVRTSLDDESPIAPPALARFGALHFAGHTAVNDQYPWRSYVTLRETRTAAAGDGAGGGRGEAQPGGTTGAAGVAERAGAAAPAATPGASDAESVRLHAEDIATSRLPARLVVLSGCESAGGRIFSGEGVAGLASAFLAAGVPTVVATLWPVEDRVTQRLILDFYRGLARGLSAAEALRAAQKGLRGRAGTADPFFWAGFVVVGEGGTRVLLAARPPSPLGPAVYLAGGAAAILIVVAWRRRRPRAATGPA